MNLKYWRLVGFPPSPRGCLALVFTKSLGKGLLNPRIAKAGVASMLSYGGGLLGIDQVRLFHPLTDTINPETVRRALQGILPAEQVYAHGGLPAFEQWLESSAKYEAERRAGGKSGTAFDQALKRCRQAYLTAPPYLVIDNRGYIRSAGIRPLTYGISCHPLLVRLSGR